MNFFTKLFNSNKTPIKDITLFGGRKMRVKVQGNYYDVDVVEQTYISRPVFIACFYKEINTKASQRGITAEKLIDEIDGIYLNRMTAGDFYDKEAIDCLNL